jgi:DNA processing protein
LSDRENNILALLQLMSVPHIGSQRIRNLISRFKSPGTALAASPRELVQINGIDKTIARLIKTGSDKKFADTQIELLHKANARMITFWDKEYPQALKNIYDPPAALFVRGSLVNDDERSVAVVGTRSPGAYGKLITEKLSRELAQNNITVISGLARGVDTIAHRASLSGGGRTIAVLGSGVDVIYPDENSSLAESIMEKGALLSEFPMGSKPDAPHFPRRNRLISGIGKGVIVVEAGLKSGALITAHFAADQGREVFAVPGNINNPKSHGCNSLIQQGAKLICSIQDVLDELQFSFSGDNSAKNRLPDVSLSEAEKKLLDILTTEPLHIDRIAKAVGWPTYNALAVLLSLELKNLIRQIPGKNFVRA